MFILDDDTSTNNSMSINESYLEILNNDLDPTLFVTNLYSENENLENYSSLSQGLSSLDNFKLMPINVKEKIINIMSKKRKRNNN
mgnify:CR=1 FL=1